MNRCYSAMCLAISAAAAAALGTAGSSAAQVPTDTTAGADTTMPGDTMTQRDTMLVSDSAAGGVVYEPAGDTVSMYRGSQRMGRFGNGFYIGVGGGASIPTGNLHDGGYDTGWNVTVPIGWQSRSTP